MKDSFRRRQTATAAGVKYATSVLRCGVDPLPWTPEDWGRQSSSKESTCHEYIHAMRRSFERKRSAWFAKGAAPRDNWPRIWVVYQFEFGAGSSRATISSAVQT